jgi:hypothetical protein
VKIILFKLKGFLTNYLLIPLISHNSCLNTKEVIELTLAVILMWCEYLLDHLDVFREDLDGQLTATKTKRTAAGKERFDAFLAVVSDVKSFWGTKKSQTKDAAKSQARHLKEKDSFWSAVNEGSKNI